MVKPVMNQDGVEFDDIEKNGIYTSSRATIGAQRLGKIFRAESATDYYDREKS